MDDNRGQHWTERKRGGNYRREGGGGRGGEEVGGGGEDDEDESGRVCTVVNPGMSRRRLGPGFNPERAAGLIPPTNVTASAAVVLYSDRTFIMRSI